MIPMQSLPNLPIFTAFNRRKPSSPTLEFFGEYAPFEKDTAISVREQPIGEELDRLLTVFPREDAKILEYWNDNSLFSNWKKPPKRFVPDKARIRDDLAFYREKGMQYISSFACYFGKDYTDLYGEPDLSAFQ